jgi:DNA-directed RNA polymerase specialized sigma24 family protein
MAASIALSQGAFEAGVLERDAELMLRVRDGDEGSFVLLIRRHRSPVIHFLYRMIQNQAVAEELAQEVFLRVYRSRETYEPTAKFTTWVFRIASHLALNWIRDHKAEKQGSGGSLPMWLRTWNSACWLMRAWRKFARRSSSYPPSSGLPS